VTIEQLSDEDRAEALDALDEWDYDEGRDAITRKFLFADFSEAFAFIPASPCSPRRRIITQNGRMSGTGSKSCSLPMMPAAFRSAMSTWPRRSICWWIELSQAPPLQGRG